MGRPAVGSLSSSDVYRINSTAAKINESFEEARQAARDEALWLSGICRQLLAENDSYRSFNEVLKAENDELKRRSGVRSSEDAG